ncbi:MAG: dephospho-CoA kinase [Myxococcales bacterium]|nr:dephospho-CoA kinase [Myxococcales bacterium]
MKNVLGLTGGIACGKSTVAKLFREHGVEIVDADQVARDVVAKGTPGLAAIVEAFGDEVLLPDGTLDRKKLGAIVFADPEKRKQLEAITHPLIAREGMRQLMELQKSGAPYLLYEAALLVEGGTYKNFPGLIVVTSSPEVQLRRLMARDASTEEEARARIASQLPLREKEALADIVIRNDGDLHALREAVDDAHRRIMGRFVEGES